jgi:hypothetical protein
MQKTIYAPIFSAFKLFTSSTKSHGRSKRRSIHKMGAVSLPIPLAYPAGATVLRAVFAVLAVLTGVAGVISVAGGEGYV